MKFGSKGMVSHVKFHEFELIERGCDSLTRIGWSSATRLSRPKRPPAQIECFNARVASYLLGVALVRRQFPPYAPLVRFVRDIQPERLGVPLTRISTILLDLPESIHVDEARAPVRPRSRGLGRRWRST